MPAMRRQEEVQQRGGHGHIATRAVAPVRVGADRAVAPVLPAARRTGDVMRPRRGADEQVAPLNLRAPAVGGELARRPARAVCIVPRTAEIDHEDEALSRALLAVIVGVRRAVTTEEVAHALEDVHGLPPASFSVHCHRPEDFLIYFASAADKDRVLGEGVLESLFFRLLLRPWSRRTHAASGGLCVHTELEIEGVPANAWSLATAEAVLAPAAWVERLHPLTCSRADMGIFRLSAWSLDPATIPREVDLHVVEPDDPPSLEDIAAPAQAVVPPHINTLAYPLIVHVTWTTDFRRSAPRGEADRRGDDDGGQTAAWPARRQYHYTIGAPDSLPGAGDGGGASSSGQAGGGGRGTTRTLASGVVVGDLDQPASRLAQKKKRKSRGGRKVRRLKAMARAAESAGRQDEQDPDAMAPLEEDGPVKSTTAGVEGAAGAAGESAANVGAVVLVGSLVVLPATAAAGCQGSTTTAAAARQGLVTTALEPPSVQASTLDSWAGPFVPRPLLGLDAFTAQDRSTEPARGEEAIQTGVLGWAACLRLGQVRHWTKTGMWMRLRGWLRS